MSMMFVMYVGIQILSSLNVILWMVEAAVASFMFIMFFFLSSGGFWILV